MFWRSEFPLAVLRIRDILVRSRILLFSSVTSKMATKNSFFFQVFLFIRYFLNLHFHHYSMIKVIKKSQNRKQGFLHVSSCWWGRSVQLTNGSGSGRPKKTHGSDPDPQHCVLEVWRLTRSLDVLYGSLWGKLGNVESFLVQNHQYVKRNFFETFSNKNIESGFSKRPGTDSLNPDPRRTQNCRQHLGTEFLKLVNFSRRE